jgi:IS5 family transposase
VEVTGANVHGLDAADKLIRKDDDFVNVDAGYMRDEIQKDEHLTYVDYRINKRKGDNRKQDDKVYKDPMSHLGYIGQPDRAYRIHEVKSQAQSGACICGGKGEVRVPKAVYRGLKKNKARLYMLFCSANLLRRTWMSAPTSA